MQQEQSKNGPTKIYVPVEGYMLSTLKRAVLENPDLYARAINIEDADLVYCDHELVRDDDLAIRDYDRFNYTMEKVKPGSIAHWTPYMIHTTNKRNTTIMAQYSK